MELHLFSAPLWLVVILVGGVVYWYLSNRKLKRQREKEAQEVLQYVEGSERWRGKNVCVVVNPFGGGGRGLQIFNNIVRPMFEQAGIIITKMETQHQGHAKQIMQTLDVYKYDAVVSVSGDGMLSEILNGLYQRQDIPRKDIPPLGVIPAGTSNGLAASFGVFSIIDGVKMFLQGAPKPLDLMTLKFINDRPQKEHYSFMVIHFGMTGDADRLTETTFRWMGSLRMTFVPLYIILRKKGNRARLRFIPEEEGSKQNSLIEGKIGQEVVFDDSFGTICACITPYLAHDLKFAPNSTVNNGSIDVIIIRSSVPRHKMIKTFLDAEKGTHLNSSWVECYRTKKFILEPVGDASRGTLMMDGEALDFQPIVVEVAPQAGLFVY